MLCQNCDGTMLASTSPFLKKVNGEKKYFITYVCELCGYMEDKEAKVIGRERKEEFKKRTEFV
jgi:hypothetical protein